MMTTSSTQPSTFTTSASSPAIAPKTLNSFPETKVAAVQDAIRTHQPHHTPQSIEAIILRDADLLEQLGAVGILRTVCKVGRDTRFQTFTQAVAALQKAVDSLPALLLLPQSQMLAEPRIRVLRAFLEATQEEAGELLL